jgi:hypothetical protein
MSVPFDLLMLAIQTLVDVGGDPDPFLQQVKQLQARWTDLQIDIAQLQSYIYEAVQFEWKRQWENEKEA